MLHIFEMLFWLLLRLRTVSACLCDGVCTCVYVFVCFAICTERQSSTMCANLHRTATRQTCLQYDLQSCVKSSLLTAIPRRMHQTREDLMVLPAYLHLPLLCLSVCVRWILVRLTCRFHSACFRNVVLAVAAAVDGLCMSP